MAEFEDILLRLSRRLYPIGRAFKMPTPGDDSPPSGGFFYRLNRALAKSENRTVKAALSVLDSTLPDNDNFDEDDAANWERALGIFSAAGTTLADRKAAIRTKLNYPGTTAARQYYTYIQQVLQDSGFDVYVYENRFFEGSPPEWVTKTPGIVLGFVPAGEAIYDNFTYGDLNYDMNWSDVGITIVANSLEEATDANFVISPNLRSTFFIAGAAIDSFASVPAVRKTEFRQLIHQLKPKQTVGYLFVNYT